MYETYFGLARKPFAVTPDPRFLYQGASHREALASLVCGVRERRGFICLVGEVGTGKSTLLRALRDRLGRTVRTALLTHTTVNRQELLRMVLHELRLKDQGRTRIQMLRALNQFVVRQLRAKRPPPVLIVDEAHNLSDQVLEEIRLLTNLETSDTRLMQVVLAGQPELEQKLARPGLRQLRQRIAIWARLDPLNREEVVRYVLHRLSVAGAPGRCLFTDEALYVIWKTSGGLPRVINVLCEQSLTYAYGAGKRQVDGTLVAEAARDAGLSPRGRSLASPLWVERLGGLWLRWTKIAEAARRTLSPSESRKLHSERRGA